MNINSNRNRWYTLIIAVLTCFSIYGSITAYAVAIPYLSQILQVSENAVSLGSSFFLVGLALSLIVGGMVVDHIGAKKTVFVAFILLLVPFVLIPHVGNIEVVWALRFIQGWSLISWSAFMVSFMPLFPDKKGLASSIFLGGSIGGSGVGGIIAGYIIPNWGVEICFYILSAIALIFFVIWESTVKIPKSKVTAKKEEKEASYSQLVKMIETWGLVLIIVANMWLYFGMSTVTSSYGQFLGYSTQAIGLVTFGFTPACILGAILGGVLGDKATDKFATPGGARSLVILVAVTIALIGTAFIPIMSEINLIAFTAIIFLVMFVNALSQGAYWALPFDVYPEELRSAGSTFGCGIGSLPKFLAPLVMGVVLAPAWRFSWWTCTILSILGVIGASFIIKKHSLTSASVKSSSRREEQKSSQGVSQE
ncbi:MAG: MFS family permease [Candidatus Methanohalarchaeum thermophilum]|uniref:MFS family permease n=1 Tax=Methanohalarchaeum thermophilum TaxID=1903181 RepID=A0A1Q6DRY5_METT1|nr:MAG: MFS family permease [Candidatus Methanohalarchaeum thermophilum]